MQSSLNLTTSVFVLVVAALSLWSGGRGVEAALTSCLTSTVDTAGTAITSGTAAAAHVAAFATCAKAFCAYYIGYSTGTTVGTAVFDCVASGTGVCGKAVAGVPACYVTGDATVSSGNVYCCDDRDNCNGGGVSVAGQVACTVTTTLPTTTAASTTTTAKTSGTSAQPTAVPAFLGAACMAVTFLAAVGV